MVASAGSQVAVLVPTTILAEQHYQNFKELFKDTPVQIGLLVGALTNKEKQEVKENLKEGKIDILIGTHALFSEDVFYPSLGLAVIDEQHRFGVNQRNLLASKGPRADLLLMSATPIPRTLALTLYGDLDITTIQTFPFKKRDIVTKVLPSDAEIINLKIEETLENHQQVYVIATIKEDERILITFIALTSIGTTSGASIISHFPSNSFNSSFLPTAMT